MSKFFTSREDKIPENTVLHIYWTCGDGCCSESCELTIPDYVKTAEELETYADQYNTTPRGIYWDDIESYANYINDGKTHLVIWDDSKGEED